MEEASRLKSYLEDQQRARKKENDKQGKKHVPVYFYEKLIEETGEKVHIFNGQYWEDRAKKNWDKLIKVFD